MNIYDLGPIAAALDGAYAVVQFLSTTLEPFAGAGSAALAIVLLTVIVRLALIPVGVSQARAQRTRLRLAPRLAELRRRHGSNRERLQRETMALYAAENASPLAGCLPLLIQAPVLSLVYGLFIHPTINGHANDLLTESLAGAPLGTSLVTALTTGTAAASPATLLVSAIVLALITAVALLSRHVTTRAAAAVTAATTPATPGGPAGRSGRGPRGRGDLGAGRARGGDRGGAPVDGLPAALAPGGSAARVLSWLPLATVIVAAFVPLAAALYLLVTTTWTLTERELLRRLIR